MYHPKEVKEADVQAAILEWLAWKHIFHYRNNSGAFVFPETATHKRRFFKAGVVGAPDIVCVVKGQYVGIECKAPNGKQSHNQKEFQRQLEAAGGRYILAYSLDDVMGIL
jgi:hypothetical protein